jgi:hypothetical protein
MTADTVQTTTIEIFCCTCNFLLSKIELPPGGSPVIVLNIDKDPNCSRPRTRYRVKSNAASTISEASQYKDADCFIEKAVWDGMTDEAKAPVLKKYRFIFYKDVENKPAVKECEAAVLKLIETRKFAQSIPVTIASGCYADKRCREPIKKCASCKKRADFDANLQSKSRRREQELLVKRAQLRGEVLPKADKPPVVCVAPTAAAVPVAEPPVVPTVQPVVPQPGVKRPVTMRQWLELRNQELRNMGKKHSKQKPAKGKKVKAKKQKTAKPAKKGKKGKKARRVEEEE